MFRVTFQNLGNPETLKFSSLSDALEAVESRPGDACEMWQTLPNKESIRIA